MSRAASRAFARATRRTTSTTTALARVETHRFALPGVSTGVRPLRHYLDGAIAAHVLGTLGEIRGEQLEREAFESYRSGDVIGQTGLEAVLEAQLRGRSGGRNVMVDAAGREVQVLDEVAPEAGSRVVLSLDLDLQRAALEAFHDVPEGEPPKMGSAVAIDVRSGDVLVMLVPAFLRPERASPAVSMPRPGRRSPATNGIRCAIARIQNHYPPGSTHKAIVAAALLQEGVINANSRTFCPGSFRFGGRTYRCWKKEGHGSVDLHKALRESCDVFFYTFGVQLGVDKLANIAKSFGLGQPTGIGLPGEASGLIPSSEWKERRFGERWYPGETVSAAIGQGYNLYTPMQLAVSYAAVASGQLIRPRLVLRIEGEEGIEEMPASPGTPVAVTPERLDARAPRHDGRRRRARRYGRPRAGAGRACRRKDGYRAGRAAPAHRRHGRVPDPDPLSRPRLVRRVRAGRCARDRGRRSSSSTVCTAAAAPVRSHSASSPGTSRNAA